MSQISAFDPTAETLRSTTTSGFSSMKSEDFIRVIFAELANQDPFQPSDSSALLEQLSSIRSIESDLELMNQLKALVLVNQLSWASNLIGRMVGGLSTTNDRVAGTVVSVIRQGDDVTLELDTGWLVPIESVEQIFDVTLEP